MIYLWNLVYLVLGGVLWPWFLWQRLVNGKRRAGWAAKFLGQVTLPTAFQTTQTQRIWFHAVSVGEVNLLAPLLQAIADQQPTWQCYLTVTTVAGYELAIKKYPLLTISYAQLDFSWAIKRALRRIQPDLLILVELELWPNLIRISHDQQVPVMVINGRLSERSARGYQRLAWLVRPIMKRLSFVAAQTPDYAQRFIALGVPPPRVSISGSLKFDGAMSDRRTLAIEALREWANIQDQTPVLLAGSTGNPEEAILLTVYAELIQEFPSLRLVLVPRHPERFEQIAQLITTSGFAVQRRSQPVTLNVEQDTATVILVDVIGELSHWWGTATIGFVGGSLNHRGGQNMIEPAAFGVATCFGPQTRNFRDVVQLLLAAQAAVVVADATELRQYVQRCLREPQYACELGKRAAAIVATQQGATATTMRFIEQQLQR